LPAGAALRLPLAAGRNGFLYVYEGSAEVGPAGAARALPHRSAGVLGEGDVVELRAGPQGVQVLLLAAKPLGEPVVQYGPFVMNTRQEIEQAIADYNEGRFGSAA
jgi:redox-sensitive bicupin YhaK (pirin superfamily)